LQIVKGTGVTSVTVPTAPYTAVSGTSLLTLQNNVAFQNNTFVDSSANNFPITRNGNTTQGSFSPYGSLWSNSFSSAYLSTSNTAGQYGSSNFTIECWVNPTSFSAANVFYCYGYQNTSTRSTVAYLSGGNLRFGFSPDGSTNTDSSLGAHGMVVGNWYHVAIVRNGSTVTGYVNGIALSSPVSISGSVYASSQPVYIGSDGSNNFAGYISNLRLNNGTAVYTSNFTPSTTPLTAVSGTSLLTCQSNRFIDNSTNNFTLTVNGSPTVQRFSPFNPTSAYSTSVIGGAGYFDGSSYLSVGSGTDFNLGTSDFSMEMWYWIPSIGANCTGMVCKRQGGVASGWGMTTAGFICGMAGTWYDSYTQPYWVGSSSSTGFNNSSSTTKIGQWTHVVVTRQGTNARWFVNGQLIGYQSRTGSIDQITGYSLSIGLNGVPSEQFFTGYIVDTRISIGSVPTGYQTSSTTLNSQIFTPPTSPVTTTSQGATSSNVQLLGSYTNAGIPDLAEQNALQTVGSASVNTSVKKYGTGSLSFNGSTDYLLPSANTTPYIFGTGNFTIETWIYFNDVTSEQEFIDFRPASTNGAYPMIYVQSGTIRYFVSSSDRITSGTVTTGVWYHVAVARVGSVTTMYINGNSVGTYADTTNYLCGANRPAIGVNLNLNSHFLNGYIDDLRITNGVARYTANFTPPIAALPTY
jgi:hypothetical protein